LALESRAEWDTVILPVGVRDLMMSSVPENVPTTNEIPSQRKSMPGVSWIEMVFSAQGSVELEEMLAADHEVSYICSAPEKEMLKGLLKPFVANSADV
jgi:hypothetical protein